MVTINGCSTNLLMANCCCMWWVRIWILSTQCVCISVLQSARTTLTVINPSGWSKVNFSRCSRSLHQIRLEFAAHNNLRSFTPDESIAVSIIQNHGFVQWERSGESGSRRIIRASPAGCTVGNIIPRARSARGFRLGSATVLECNANCFTLVFLTAWFRKQILWELSNVSWSPFQRQFHFAEFLKIFVFVERPDLRHSNLSFRSGSINQKAQGKLFFKSIFCTDQQNDSPEWFVGACTVFLSRVGSFEVSCWARPWSWPLVPSTIPPPPRKTFAPQLKRFKCEFPLPRPEAFSWVPTLSQNTSSSPHALGGA